MHLFQHHPLGARIPASVHAVCCSLPTLADVRRYEEKDPATLQQIPVGYPRFVTHQYVRKLVAHLTQRHALGNRALFLAASPRAATELAAFCGAPDPALLPLDGYVGVHFAPDGDAARRATAYLQHTGTGVSSRQAEDALAAAGLVTPQQEVLHPAADPAQDVRAEVARVLGAEASDVWLTRSGMAAFHSVFETARAIQSARGRNIWLQLGWLYIDTQRVLERFLSPTERHIKLLRVNDRAAIDAAFRDHGSHIAGVITEIPTNPLLTCADLDHLGDLCERHGAFRLYDPSTESPFNVRLLEHSDATVVSITKYFANEGDVMMGVAALNPTSPFYDRMRAALPARIEHPYVRDVRRLAHEMQDAGNVVARINANTRQLVSFLERHPRVRRVHWACSPETRTHYARVAPGAEDAAGSLLTIELAKPLDAFYDRARLVKGPSFGVRFSLMCPFLYLAHYDLVTSAQGRKALQDIGLDPELVRISVGTEPFDALRDVFAEALDG